MDLFTCFIAFIILLLCLIILPLAYIYYLHQSYAHVPSPPRSSFILGHLHDIKQWKMEGKTMVDYLLKNHLEYGSVYVLYLLHRAIVVVSDPVLVKQMYIANPGLVTRNQFDELKLGFPFGTRFVGYGLVTNTNQESWYKRRQLMNPAFHRKSLKEFMVVFNLVCDKFINKITSSFDKQCHQLCMAKEFSKVTLDIISNVLFNVDLGATEESAGCFPRAFISALRVVEANFSYFLLNYKILSLFKYWPFGTTTVRKQLDEVKFLRDFSRECVMRRAEDVKCNKPTPDDLLNILVNDKTLSMDDIIDEMVTMFTAGHETTANTLAFTLYEITQNPDIEKKILHEIKETVGENEYIEFEHLPKLKYLGQVLQESLRKYPVAPGKVTRILSKQVTLNGYKLKKGTEVMIQRYSMNHSPKFWQNPDVFDPDRFSNVEEIPNFSTLYFPFNVGPHVCIGQNLAKFESKVLLARLLQKFHFELTPGQTAAVEERLTLAPKDGVHCKLTMRY